MLRTKLIKQWEYLNHMEEITNGLKTIVNGAPATAASVIYLGYRKYSKRKDLSELIDYAKHFFNLDFPPYLYDKNGMITFTTEVS